MTHASLFSGIGGFDLAQVALQIFEAIKECKNHIGTTTGMVEK